MSDTGSTGTGAAQGAAGDQQATGAQGAGGGDTGAQGAQGQAQGADSGASDGTQRTPEEWQALIEVRERENATYRERLRALEDAERKRQTASLPEEERAKAERLELEKDRDTARAELVALRFELAVSKVATRLGFRDPDDAAKFLTREELLGDDGAPANDRVDKALRDVLKAKPYLAGGTGGGGGDGGAGRGRQGAGQSMNDLIRQGARKGS